MLKNGWICSACNRINTNVSSMEDPFKRLLCCSRTAAREAAFAAGGSVKPEASMLGISGSESFTDTAVIGQSNCIRFCSKSMFGGAVEINSKNISNSTLFGVKFATFSDIYDAFTSSLKIKDYSICK